LEKDKTPSKTLVNVRAESGTVHVITSEKQVLAEKARKSITLSGVLGACSDFLLARPGQYDDKIVHLEIYKDLGKLVLVIGDDDPHTTHTITGQLSIDKNLAEFQINKEYIWTVANLRKFLLARGYFFADAQECKNIINQLNNFSAKVEKVIKDWNNNDGSSLAMLETKVEGIEMKRSFMLNLPIYQGYEKKEFKVEIGFQPTPSSVGLFLYSEDLALLVHSERERIVDNELAKFADQKFSKVLLS
jgi:hypothetical protein